MILNEIVTLLYRKALIPWGIRRKNCDSHPTPNVMVIGTIAGPSRGGGGGIASGGVGWC